MTRMGQMHCGGKERLLLVAAAALMSTFLADHAQAQPGSRADAANVATGDGDSKDLARRHYQRGIQFYKDGDYKLALVEFRRSYELSRNYRVLYNIGQVNLQLNNYARALAALEQYLRDGGTGIPADRRSAILVDTNELRGKIARIEISTNVDNAEIYIDENPVGKSPLREAILVDAGDHRIEVRRDGYQTSSRAVTLTGRENLKLDLKLAENRQVVVVSKLQPAVAQQVYKIESKPPAWLWAGWLTTGALAVGAGVTGVLAASQAGDLSALRDSPSSTSEEREATKNRARTYGITADVLAAAAVVTGAATLYFTLRPARSETPLPGAETRVGLCGTGLCVQHRY